MPEINKTSQVVGGLESYSLSQRLMVN